MLGKGNCGRDVCRGCIKGSRTAAGTVLMDAPEFKSVEGLMAAAEHKLEWNSLTNSLCPKVRKERKDKTGIDVFVQLLSSIECDSLVIISL